ncbi:substrate-binding periplasmic protein [Alteromonas gracilis]|uniref:substrate-binding periplasmic protein n=1 Tax=Alteromonas gracilis TaxID=1479524 RepID=UPI003219D7E1
MRQIVTRVGKQLSGMLFMAICLSGALLPNIALSQSVLGASPFETYVSDNGEPAKLMKIVNSAFEQAELDVELRVMRDAFLGSAVLIGKVDGRFAYIQLGENTDEYVLSNIYLPINLYAVSKKFGVENVMRFAHLNDNRVAVENRFANTPEFRLLKNIKWSRNPSTFDAFKQLADDRAPYLVTTKLLAEEFNLLLENDNEEQLHFSGKPLMTTGFQIALRKNVPNAKATIEAFNKAISVMQKLGQFNEILKKPWLTKDVNNDNVADFIASSAVTRTNHTLEHAYALDNYATSSKSLYVVNGQSFNTLEDAQEALEAANAQENASQPQSSLDATIYKQLIRKW